MLCLRFITVNLALITSDECGQEGFTIGGELTKFSADDDTLLLLVSCQDPGHKFVCDTVHAQFFRQNPLECPITNSLLPSNVVNGPTSILMDKLLNSCNSFRICAASVVSLCARHRQLMCDRSQTRHVIETPAHDSSFGPRRLVESL